MIEIIRDVLRPGYEVVSDYLSAGVRRDYSMPVAPFVDYEEVTYRSGRISVPAEWSRCLSCYCTMATALNIGRHLRSTMPDEVKLDDAVDAVSRFDFEQLFPYRLPSALKVETWDKADAVRALQMSERNETPRELSLPITTVRYDSNPYQPVLYRIWYAFDVEMHGYRRYDVEADRDGQVYITDRADRSLYFTHEQEVRKFHAFKVAVGAALQLKHDQNARLHDQNARLHDQNARLHAQDRRLTYAC